MKKVTKKDLAFLKDLHETLKATVRDGWVVDEYSANYDKKEQSYNVFLKFGPKKR